MLYYYWLVRYKGRNQLKKKKLAFSSGLGIQKKTNWSDKKGGCGWRKKKKNFF
mgnify:CR=1 FL=1